MPLPLPKFDWTFLPRDQKVLVACSGGADSMALLLALHEAKYSLVVAHVNHGLRGRESDEDEKFVRKAAKFLGVPFAARRLKFNEHVDEATMRDARYEALLQLAREYSCTRIATGHTATDSVETILLNILRGSPVRGLCGIAAERELVDGILLVRPLIEHTREFIKLYVRDSGWSWCEDASNQDQKYFRNRIRNELLPKVLELARGGILDKLLESGEVLRRDIELLDELANDVLKEILIDQTPELLILNGLKFRAQHIALQRRLLRQAVFTLRGDVRDLSFERVEEVRRHIEANKRRAVWQWHKELLVEWTGEYSGNRIRFSRVTPDTRP